MKRWTCVAMMAAGVVAVSGRAEDETPAAAAPAKPLRDLAVGNSFSLNATRQLPGLAKAAGKALKVVNASIGGCDFERHMRHADAYERDPASKEGNPYGGKSLKDMLTRETWDVVTVQQASPKSFKPETFQPHADRLIAYIRKHAPQAEVVVHQTWAYRDDHKFWGRKDLNTDSMYAKLRAAYDGLAKGAGLRLIPSGDAMEAARRDAAWGPFLSGEPPTPRPEKALHAKDGYHANVKGEYLQGCVWFEFLFRESVVGNSFVPKGLTAEEAAVLQRIAHGVVSDGTRPEPRVQSPDGDAATQ